jgi:hypothetical protein
MVIERDVRLDADLAGLDAYLRPPARVHATWRAAVPCAPAGA